MTDPIEDALDAWAGVFDTVLGLAVAHAETHLPVLDHASSGGKPGGEPGSAGFQMSTSIRCEPLPRPQGSAVTINIPAPPDDVDIVNPGVVHVVPGTMPASSTAGSQSTVLDSTTVITAGATTLVLGLPPMAQGLHVGHVSTPNGAKLAPIVLYVDDALVP